MSILLTLIGLGLQQPPIAVNDKIEKTMPIILELSSPRLQTSMGISIFGLEFAGELRLDTGWGTGNRITGEQHLSYSTLFRPTNEVNGQDEPALDQIFYRGKITKLHGPSERVFWNDFLPWWGRICGTYLSKNERFSYPIFWDGPYRYSVPTNLSKNYTYQGASFSIQGNEFPEDLSVIFGRCETLEEQATRMRYQSSLSTVYPFIKKFYIWSDFNGPGSVKIYKIPDEYGQLSVATKKFAILEGSPSKNRPRTQYVMRLRDQKILNIAERARKGEYFVNICGFWDTSELVYAVNIPNKKKSEFRRFRLPE